MAARILFYIVHWLRSIKEFQMIPVKDQVAFAVFLVCLSIGIFDCLDDQFTSMLARNLSFISLRIQIRCSLDQSDSFE